MSTEGTRIGRTPKGGGVNPQTDADRVLGQIERGEVQAGPEGARRIAERHMEEYGREVWGE